MITQEEHNKIVQEVIESVLLRMPEVIGNLMSHHAMVNKINKEFYEKNKDFLAHKDIVAAVIESLEGKNPAKKYEDIVQEAIPEIRQKINTMKSLNTTSINSAPSRSMPIDLSNNGVL